MQRHYIGLWGPCHYLQEIESNRNSPWVRPKEETETELHVLKSTTEGKNRKRGKTNKPEWNIIGRTSGEAAARLTEARYMSKQAGQSGDQEKSKEGP